MGSLTFAKGKTSGEVEGTAIDVASINSFANSLLKKVAQKQETFVIRFNNNLNHWPISNIISYVAVYKRKPDCAVACFKYSYAI